MIKVADHTDRLAHLRNVLGDDDAAEREADRICLLLFRATLDDIMLDEDAFDAWMSWEPSACDAIQFCKAHGYDITVDGRVAVPDFEIFYAMVRAKADGLLPTENGSDAERKLAADARRFLRERDDGLIKGH